MAKNEKISNNKKNNTKLKTETRQSNSFFIILSIIAIAGGVIGLYLYMGSKTQTLVPQKTVRFSGIIYTNSEKKIDGGGRNASDILKDVAAELTSGTRDEGSIEHVAFTATAKTGVQEVTWDEFRTALNVTPPGILSRSLSDTFMYGIYQKNGAHPFFILKTSSYDQAFPGMLSWESTLPHDIAPFFSAPALATTNGTFKDRLIQNKDARILTDDKGNIILLYIFLSNDTILIAEDTATISEVLYRLSTPRVTQ